MCSAAEATIDFGVHEAKDVCVSLGLKEGDYTVTDREQLGSVLDRDFPFLQLNGRSTIEVDEQGIFISIPTFQPAAPAIGAAGQAQVGGGKASFNTSRRGLRLPASPSMSGACAQPSCLVLRVPITRKSVEASAESPVEGEGGGGEGEDREQVMRRFLSSSILAIPWVYEGHNLRPAAYIAEDGARLSAEERECISREAEEDSIIFANTVCALAEFISSVPEGTAELLLCFACPDRQARDLLALGTRCLACQPGEATRLERALALPWRHGADADAGTGVGAGAGEQEGVAEHSESGQDLRRRLKALEAEHIALKRERSELMLQLLAARDREGAAQGKADRGCEDVQAGAEHLQASGPARPAVSEAVDSRQQLELIELQNKLSIAGKKEGELAKARAELEARNAKLSAEADKARRQVEGLGSKVRTLQALYDRQALSLQLLEDAQAAACAELEEQRRQGREKAALQKELQQKDAVVAELKYVPPSPSPSLPLCLLLLSTRCCSRLIASVLRRKALETAQQDVASLQRLQERSATQLSELQAGAAAKERQQATLAAQLELQLAEALLGVKRLELDKAALEQEAATQLELLEEARKAETRLKETEARAEQLAAEMNHLSRKSESQGRDLKRVMKDNAAALSEFEKALVRKSEECNVSRILPRNSNNNSRRRRRR